MAEFSREDIAKLNAEGKRLNALRQQQMGARDAARQEFERKAALYQEQYGVALDDTNLQSEFDKESKKVQEAAQAMKAQIDAINNGTFIEETIVVKPTIISSVSEGSTSSIGVTPIAPVATEPVTPVTPTTPVATEPVQPVQPSVQIPTPAFTVPISSAPTAPVTPVMPTTPAESAKESPKPAFTIPTSSDSDDVADKPFTPAGWGTPANGGINGQFGSILSGTKFGGNN